MRLLVCGSRRWTQHVPIAREIEALAPSVLIHGDADGADRIAASVVRLWGNIAIVPFPADWERDGNAAGPIRNSRMLRDGKPDRGLAFGALWRRSGSPSVERSVGAKLWKPTGTGNMVAKMLRAGLPVRWVPAPAEVAIDLVEMPGVPS